MNTDLHAFRLKPGQDLKKEIRDFAVRHNITAGWIITCVGSLTTFNMRFANQPEGTVGTGHFEIITLSGTISMNGSHLHIAISDQKGELIGGHLLEGNIIFTTAELVIGSTRNLIFNREIDAASGYKELQVEQITGSNTH